MKKRRTLIPVAIALILTSSGLMFTDLSGIRNVDIARLVVAGIAIGVAMVLIVQRLKQPSERA